MPFVITRSDAPSKMFASRDADGDYRWVTTKDKATPHTEDEADVFVHEFGKYSDIDLDIEGVKPVAAAAEPGAEAA